MGDGPSAAEVLDHAAVFRQLPEDDRARLVTAGRCATFAKGEQIRVFTEHMDTVHVLLWGGVQVDLLSADGRECALLLRRRRGDIFMLATGPEPADSVAAKALPGGAEVFPIPQQLLLDAVVSHRAALDDLMLVVKLHDLQRLRVIHELAFFKVRARLAHTVAELAEEEPDHTVHLSRSELAVLVGTSEAETTRELHQLRDEGLVAFRDHQPRRIVALDLEGLAHYGKGGKTKSR